MRTIFLILIALTLVGGTVVSAQNDLPGESLYGLKLWSEEAMLRVTPIPEWQLYLSERWASRRLLEVTTLVAKKKPEEVKADVERAAVIIGKTLDKTKGALEIMARRSTARALLSAFLLETRVAVFRRELTILQNQLDNDELTQTLRPVLEKLDELNGIAASMFEDLERKAKPEVIEAGAKLLVKKVGDQIISVRAHYERLKARGVGFSGEVEPTLAHAERKLKEAQDFLKIGQYRPAFAVIRESFRIVETFGLKFDLADIRRELGAPSLDAPPQAPAAPPPAPSSAPPSIQLPPPNDEGLIEVPLDDGRQLRIRTEPVE